MVEEWVKGRRVLGGSTILHVLQGGAVSQYEMPRLGMLHLGQDLFGPQQKAANALGGKWGREDILGRDILRDV